MSGLGLTKLFPMPGLLDQGTKTNIKNINEHAIPYDVLLAELDTFSTFINSKVIDITKDIDCLTTGETDLFTVPTGQNFFVDSIIIQVQEADSITDPVEISIGSNIDLDNMLPITELTGLLDTTKFFKVSPSGLISVCAAADVLKIKITTAGAGTTFKLRTYLCGLLI